MLTTPQTVGYIVSSATVCLSVEAVRKAKDLVFSRSSIYTDDVAPAAKFSVAPAQPPLPSPPAVPLSLKQAI